MIQGMYSSQTALQAYTKAQSFVANNIANINTQGFQARETHMTELKTGGVNLSNVSIKKSQGYMLNTGNPMDITIEGNGYFRLTKQNMGGVANAQNPGNNNPDANTQLTRNGAFRLDGDGNLVDARGDMVVRDVSENPDDRIAIGKKGDIYVNGEKTAKIDIFDRYGNKMPEENYSLKTGYLEASNVDAAREIVNMITNQRAFEVNTKMITTNDEMLGYIVDMKG